MKEFVLLFRRDEETARMNMSPDKMQKVSKEWQDWLDGLAARKALVNMGNRLASEGKVVRPNNVVTNGPYAEIKETIGGFSIVRAKNIDEAAEIARGCPILGVNGAVEVRTIVSMDAAE